MVSLMRGRVERRISSASFENMNIAPYMYTGQQLNTKERIRDRGWREYGSSRKKSLGSVSHSSPSNFHI